MNKLQNEYLDKLCQSKTVISLYLINGIKLLGYISNYDDQIILLKDNKDTMEQMIYKHAVSTIVPSKS